MYWRNPLRIRVLVLTVMISGGAESAGSAPQLAQTRDALGGASSLIKRPRNPEVRKRSRSSRQNAGSKPQRARAESNTASTNVNDQVEDAIELGNAARDRQPPDLVSAEKAYRLAWKLNPKDPRPYVGLANVYMDQEKFHEAAEAYKEALKLWAPHLQATMGLRGVGVGRIRGPAAEWQVYLATASINLGKLREAEKVLKEAISVNPRNAEWQALLGYALSAQNRFTAASDAYRVATLLDPKNNLYQHLFERSSQQAREASAQDSSLTKKLQDTSWAIHDAQDSNSVKGTCRLRSGNRLQCDAAKKGNLLHNDLRWRIQDGFIEVTQTKGGDTVCVGKIEAPASKHMQVRCVRDGVDSAEAWTRK